MKGTGIEHRRRAAEHFRARYGDQNADWRIHLIGAAMPDVKPETGIFDYPIVNYFGYSERVVPAGNLPPIALDVRVYVCPLSVTPFEWPAPPAPVNVFGWLLYDQSTGAPLAYELFGQVLAFPAGNALRLSLALRVGECP